MRAWLLTVAGGGACGLVAMGLLSVIMFPISVPAGMVLGAILGLPLGLVFALAFARFASPSSDAARFKRRVMTAGMLIGLTANATFLVIQGLTYAPPLRSELMVAEHAANDLLTLVGAAVVGRECGRRLAIAHLRAGNTEIASRRRRAGAATTAARGRGLRHTRPRCLIFGRSMCAVAALAGAVIAFRHAAPNLARNRVDPSIKAFVSLLGDLLPPSARFDHANPNYQDARQYLCPSLQHEISQDGRRTNGVPLLALLTDPAVGVDSVSHTAKDHAVLTVGQARGDGTAYWLADMVRTDGRWQLCSVRPDPNHLPQ